MIFISLIIMRCDYKTHMSLYELLPPGIKVVIIMYYNTEAKTCHRTRHVNEDKQDTRTEKSTLYRIQVVFLIREVWRLNLKGSWTAETGRKLTPCSTLLCCYFRLCSWKNTQQVINWNHWIIYRWYSFTDLWVCFCFHGVSSLQVQMSCDDITCLHI